MLGGSAGGGSFKPEQGGGKRASKPTTRSSQAMSAVWSPLANKHLDDPAPCPSCGRITPALVRTGIGVELAAAYPFVRAR